MLSELLFVVFLALIQVAYNVLVDSIVEVVMMTIDKKKKKKKKMVVEDELKSTVNELVHKNTISYHNLYVIYFLLVDVDEYHL